MADWRNRIQLRQSKMNGFHLKSKLSRLFRDIEYNIGKEHGLTDEINSIDNNSFIWIVLGEWAALWREP